METLIALVQHRNQYYSRGDSQVSAGFGDINCRAFESGGCSLSTPLRADSTPALDRSLSSPKTPTPSVNLSPNLKGKDGRSSPIAIGSKVGQKERTWNNNASFSELWAGPAYSNSPPPSSLPMPKFSLKPKRTVSLELPAVESEVDLHPIAKSAPTSPTGGLKHAGVSFLHDDDSATKALRRILNLDIAD